MESRLVFEGKTEMERLCVQNRLLSCYEDEIFAHLFAGRSGLAVLDIGCNNGSKTVARFASDAVSKVMGLEYHEEVASTAQKAYGNAKFSFHCLDAEAPAFAEKLRCLMAQRAIDGFDVIYLSFVLLHLQDVKALLRALRAFLKPDGHLVILEANDSATKLTPDDKGLVAAFLAMLREDPFSGNRHMGAQLPKYLADCGYEPVTIWHDAVTAGAREQQKKQAIFTTFFSYLPEDVALLRQAEPENKTYQAWADWLDCHYPELEHGITQEPSEISMGIRMLSCGGGGIV